MVVLHLAAGGIHALFAVHQPGSGHSVIGCGCSGRHEQVGLALGIFDTPVSIAALHRYSSLEHKSILSFSAGCGLVWWQLPASNYGQV